MIEEKDNLFRVYLRVYLNDIFDQKDEIVYTVWAGSKEEAIAKAIANVERIYVPKEVKIIWARKRVEAVSDPLTLAVVSMIVGMVLGAAAAVLALLICIELGVITVIDLTKQENVPSEEDIKQMSLWYDANYGKDGD